MLGLLGRRLGWLKVGIELRFGDSYANSIPNICLCTSQTSKVDSAMSKIYNDWKKRKKNIYIKMNGDPMIGN